MFLENLMYIIIGFVMIEIVLSIGFYEIIDSILDFEEGKGFLDLNIAEALLVIFCWPGALYRKIFGGKKPFYQKTLKEIFFPKRAKAEEVAKKLEKDASN